MTPIEFSCGHSGEKNLTEYEGDPLRLESATQYWSGQVCPQCAKAEQDAQIAAGADLPMPAGLSGDSELMAAVKSGYRAKMAAAALGALVIGLVGGYLVVNGSSSGTSAAVQVPSPDVSASTAETGTTDTEGGWSEQGAASFVPDSDANAPLPVDVNTRAVADPNAAYAWNYKPAKDGIPSVILWEDFQCPACKAFEASGAAKYLVDKANAGEINLIFRPLAFLDMALHNDSSVRATAAWGCAIDAGVGEKYRELVYGNQPAQEGKGFTDTELLSGGKVAGLTGDAYTKFEDCFKAGTYRYWAGTSTTATPPEIGGTPTIMINGKILDNKTGWNPSVLDKAIKAAK